MINKILTLISCFISLLIDYSYVWPRAKNNYIISREYLKKKYNTRLLTLKYSIVYIEGIIEFFFSIVIFFIAFYFLMTLDPNKSIASSYFKFYSNLCKIVPVYYCTLYILAPFCFIYIYFNNLIKLINNCIDESQNTDARKTFVCKGISGLFFVLFFVCFFIYTCLSSDFINNIPLSWLLNILSIVSLYCYMVSNIIYKADKWFLLKNTICFLLLPLWLYILEINLEEISKSVFITIFLGLILPFLIQLFNWPDLHLKVYSLYFFVYDMIFLDENSYLIFLDNEENYFNEKHYNILGKNIIKMNKASKVIFLLLKSNNIMKKHVLYESVFTNNFVLFEMNDYNKLYLGNISLNTINVPFVKKVFFISNNQLFNESNCINFFRNLNDFDESFREKPLFDVFIKHDEDIDDFFLSINAEHLELEFQKKIESIKDGIIKFYPNFNNEVTFFTEASIIALYFLKKYKKMFTSIERFIFVGFGLQNRMIYCYIQKEYPQKIYYIIDHNKYFIQNVKNGKNDYILFDDVFEILKNRNIDERKNDAIIISLGFDCLNYKIAKQINFEYNEKNIKENEYSIFYKSQEQKCEPKQKIISFGSVNEAYDINNLTQKENS